MLETARGGMPKRGLACDRCDVAVVPNVTADHLGQDGIETIDDLAAVKGMVLTTARKAAVLNADDPVCVGLAKRIPRGVEPIWFGFDAAHGAMAARLARAVAQCSKKVE